MYHNKLLWSLVESNDKFIEMFKEMLFQQNLTITEFCKKTKIPESTVYKIMSNPKKDFRISTFRNIIQEVRKIEGIHSDKITIGIITTRGALDSINRKIHLHQKEIIIKEYPATTIEEEIIHGIQAERAGVNGLICGPIAATTLEKVVNIPVMSIQFERDGLIQSLENILKKI
jgi:predicted transcriptional regulator